MSLPRVPSFSPPSTGLLVGAIVGLIDVVLVHGRIGRGGAWMPATDSPLLWLAILWVWATAGALAGLLVSPSRLKPLRGLAIAGAGPGLLLMARAAPALNDSTGLSTTVILGLCAAATVAVSLPLAALAAGRTHHPRLWTGAVLVSLAALGWAASGLDPRDFVGRAAHEREPGGRPNVALVFLDTVRFDDALGPKPSMPGLAEFASRSVSFESAWAPASWTEPTHEAVFTGLEPWVGEGGQRTTLAERFRRGGYATAAIFSNVRLASQTRGYEHLYLSISPRVCRSGIGALMARSPSYGGPAFPFCGAMPATEVTARALRFIRKEQRPFFLTLNYLDAHDPYYVPRACRDAGTRITSRGERMWVTTARPTSRNQPPEHVRKALHDQYRASLRCMDRSLADLLRELSAIPGTIVAVVGDHGEQFGEHGYGAHGNSPYRQVLHVPLVLSVPGLPPAKVADPVSVTDLHETLIQAVEGRRPLRLLEPPSRRRPAVSFLRYTSGRPGAEPETALSLADGSFHLLAWSDGRQELYDYRADPAEVRPLGPEADAIRARMLPVIAREAQRMRGAAAAEFNALGYLQ